MVTMDAVGVSQIALIGMAWLASGCVFDTLLASISGIWVILIRPSLA